MSSAAEQQQQQQQQLDSPTATADSSSSPSLSHGSLRRGHFLEVAAPPLRFAPVSAQGGDPSVFFDECNRQVRLPRHSGHSGLGTA